MISIFRCLLSPLKRCSTIFWREPTTQPILVSKLHKLLSAKKINRNTHKQTPTRTWRKVPNKYKINKAKDHFLGEAQRSQQDGNKNLVDHKNKLFRKKLKKNLSQGHQSPRLTKKTKILKSLCQKNRKIQSVVFKLIKKWILVKRSAAKNRLKFLKNRSPPQKAKANAFNTPKSFKMNPMIFQVNPFKKKTKIFKKRKNLFKKIKAFNLKNRRK